MVKRTSDWSIYSADYQTKPGDLVIPGLGVSWLDCLIWARSKAIHLGYRLTAAEAVIRHGMKPEPFESILVSEHGPVGIVIHGSGVRR